MAEVMGNEPHADPDAQATVTDFIDYTEHLPSDVRRSLALIKKLNDLIQSAHHQVHELTKLWNAGVEASNGQTADESALALRAKISYQKSLSTKYAAAALAEAHRMNDEIARHQKLISITSVKLDALPLPPSRDPTPQPLPQSPQATRVSTGPAIRLRIGNNRISARSVQQHGGPPRSRRKRVIVPGEVLPPPNPDSPTPSDFSESESPPPLPLRLSPKLEVRTKATEKRERKKDKAPKPPKSDIAKILKKERAPRPAGIMGTNVHSQIAGISTSNALAKLTPPPNDAAVGGEHAPWMRLTEYEMAKLRKRMKKNAIWAPSDTMIRRELTDAGRGPENYRKAKQYAEEHDTKFADCDDLLNKDPNIPLAPGEIPLETQKAKLVNKGMSLNVQKKEKKALQQKALAEQARLDAEQAAKNLGQLGESFKNLFERDTPIEKIVLKTPATSRKRKRDQPVPATAPPAAPAQLAPQPSEESQIQNQLLNEIIVTPTALKPPAQKKQRKAPAASPAPPRPVIPLSPAMPIPPAAKSPIPATSTTTTTIPLAAAAPSPAKATTPTTQPPPSPATAGKEKEQKPRRLSLVVKPQAESSSSSAAALTAVVEASTLSTSRPQSRPASRRASAGPPPELSTRDRLRRKSATPGPATPGIPHTLASRRAKRPAPGPVTSSQEGGNAISVGKRSKKPGKGRGRKAGDKGEKKKEEEVIEEEEEIDPNEPKYCDCGDVSYGSMIMCENPDCEKEWFHLECVGLIDIPPRRVKWWCPDCSEKLGRNKS